MGFVPSTCWPSIPTRRPSGSNWSLEERGRFTAVGTGIVKVREAVQAAIETSVEWVAIEQDQLRNLAAFETIAVSYLNLKEAGLV